MPHPHRTRAHNHRQEAPRAIAIAAAHDANKDWAADVATMLALAAPVVALMLMMANHII